MKDLISTVAVGAGLALFNWLCVAVLLGIGLIVLFLGLGILAA